MSAGRCYWTKDDDGDPVLIPHCWGAVNDPAACTCGTPMSRIEAAEAGRAAAEAEVDRLRDKLRRASDRYAGMLAENQRFRTKLRAYCP